VRVRIHPTAKAGGLSANVFVKPLIMVGDLGDPNAVERKRGFDDVTK